MPEFDPYDCLVPIFLRTEARRGVKQIASAVFAEMQSDYFLFTAAHVTDQLRNGELLVPSFDGLSVIEGYLAYIDLPPEESRQNDEVDIAYYKLTSDFASVLSHHFTPISATNREVVGSALELQICSASGFPASKAKNYGGLLSSEVFSFTGAAAAADLYDELSLSPVTNIVIRFRRKAAVKPEDGTLFPTPGLKGISGGAIFAWPLGATTIPDWPARKLVGVVHTYKEREGLIIGTTLVPLLAATSLGRMKSFGKVA